VFPYIQTMFNNFINVMQNSCLDFRQQSFLQTTFQNLILGCDVILYEAGQSYDWPQIQVLQALKWVQARSLLLQQGQFTNINRGASGTHHSTLIEGQRLLDRSHLPNEDKEIHGHSAVALIAPCISRTHIPHVCKESQIRFELD